MKLLPLLSYSANVLLIAYITFSSALVVKSAHREGERFTKARPADQVLVRTSKAVGVETSIPPHDCSAIIEGLRKGGAKASLLYAVAQAFIGERDRSAMGAIFRPSGVPRWRSKNHSLSDDDRARLDLIRKRQEDDMKQLLGADYMTALAERAPPGSPSPEKRLAIRDLERDYMEIRRNLGMRASSAEIESIDRNFEKDLAAVLSPPELAEYLAYESRLASRLQGNLSGLEMDDLTYRKIYDAVAASPMKQLKEGSSAKRLALAKIVGEVGGSEFAVHVAAKQDGTFRDIAAIYGEEKFGSDAVWKNYERFILFHDELASFQKAPPADGLAALKKMAEKTYSELTSGLSDSARARFDKTNTGSLLVRSISAKSL